MTNSNTLSLDDKISLIVNALDDLKAKEITVMTVEHLTEVAERIIIANATSKRHVKALADKLGAAAKEQGLMPLGREGDKDSDWTLVDLGAVVVHIMTPQAREFYDLEGLWSSPDALKSLAVAPKD
ncbi:ribosome silencing factor [Moraxella caviae]|uniref:Ribosomal silencing factor RsfS n=1 Tax=Moraxella caviae TaxID=34060 RepID=A0A1T0A1U7_9GAMM|nr:ribosome silencing factor [Moraxella caviae]OOR89655.1 ribosome silencing factor [Moraxella caviae]STZ10329.1 ribosome-associated protein [Moraxella caviae]VEW10441.1 ribosome-associated protein [Moraxella caviae]